MPAWLRTHPLTTERIADIEARIRDMPYRQRVDSLDFTLVKARLRVLQDDTPRGWRDTSMLFAEQIKQGTRAQVQGARYGLAMIALRQREIPQARVLLDAMHAGTDRRSSSEQSVLLLGLELDISLANGDSQQAVALAADGRNRFPLSRSLSMQYAEALMATGRKQEAANFLRDQAQIYRQDAGIQKALARAYAEQNKQALQHMALAEFYAISGALPAALEQLRIARNAPDAAFHDLAIIDARERELQASWRDIMSQRKK
jgi:predicted Zn-dependent protease